MTQDESEPHDQDYRSDNDQAQKPSNIIMLRMLPPNATVNEVQHLYLYMNHCITKPWILHEHHIVIVL